MVCFGQYLSKSWCQIPQCGVHALLLWTVVAAQGEPSQYRLVVLILWLWLSSNDDQATYCAALIWEILMFNYRVLRLSRGRQHRLQEHFSFTSTLFHSLRRDQWNCLVLLFLSLLMLNCIKRVMLIVVSFQLEKERERERQWKLSFSWVFLATPSLPSSCAHSVSLPSLQSSLFHITLLPSVPPTTGLPVHHRASLLRNTQHCLHLDAIVFLQL